MRPTASLAAAAFLALALLPDAPPIPGRAATPCPEPTPAASPVPGDLLLMPEDARITLFDEVWAAIDLGYLDDGFNGTDWAAIGDEYAPYFLQLESADEVWDLAREMLDLLGDDEVFFTDALAYEALQPAETDYVGIGALVDGDRAEEEGLGPRILYLFPGGGAEEAGLAPRDRIVSVDGDPCVSVGRIRGPEGTTVELGIARPGEGERTVVVERRRIDPVIRPVTRRIGMDDAIGYLRLDSLEGEELYAALEEALTDFAEDPVTGIVLDVRSTNVGAPGVTLGLLSHLMEGDAGALYSRAESAPIELLDSDLVGRLGALPVVILVDEGSIGEAERLALILQAAGRATVIGAPTEGRTRTIRDLPLSDGSYLSLPTIGLELPGGRRLMREGVVPDVPIAEDWLAVPEADDPGILAAVSAIEAVDGCGAPAASAP